MTIFLAPMQRISSNITIQVARRHTSSKYFKLPETLASKKTLKEKVPENNFDETNHGWNFLELNNQIELDAKNEEKNKKINDLLVQSEGYISQLNKQTNNADLLIGLGQYIYKMRDQYRYAIYLALKTLWDEDFIEPLVKDNMDACPIESPSQIKLSVGWLDNFELSKMNQCVHKILTVTLTSNNTNDLNPSDNSDAFMNIKKDLFKKLHDLIETKKFDPLVSLNIIASSLPSVSNSSLPESPMLIEGQKYIESLIKQHTVVIFYQSPVVLARNEYEKCNGLREGLTGDKIEDMKLLIHEETSKLERHQFTWRKLFNSHQLIPYEVNINELNIKNLTNMKSDDSKDIKNTLKESNISQVFKIMDQKENNRLIMAALSKFSNNSKDYPIIFIKGVYSGSVLQLDYFKRNHYLFNQILNKSHQLRIQSNREKVQNYYVHKTKNISKL